MTRTIEAYYSMNIDDHGNKFEDSQTKMELVGTIEKIDETCSRCKPLSMVSCVTNCKVWRLKNELRELHKRTQEKDFTTSLLNTIKSRRRQQILDLVCKGHHLISRLQDELNEFYDKIKTDSIDGENRSIIVYMPESQFYINDDIIMDELGDISNIIDYIATKIITGYPTKYHDKEMKG